MHSPLAPIRLTKKMCGKGGEWEGTSRDRVNSSSFTHLFKKIKMAAVMLMLLYWLRRRRQNFKNSRRFWVHGINKRRATFGEYHHLMEDVLYDEEKCLSYIRMKPATFQLLLDKVGPYIQKNTTNFRKPLSPKERLIITLRYFFKFVFS